MTTRRPASARDAVPALLRLSRALERRRWRGGAATERMCRRLGLLERVVRHKLGRGITVDVPLRTRPMDAVDVDAYESALVDVLTTALDAMPGPVFLFDCGADFGLVTLKLVARCPAIERVVAFEPNAGMYPTLVANLERLRCRADAVLAAVADAPGRGELRYPEHDPASDVSRYVEPTATGGVPITTIDTLAIAPGGCVALKCDVEGSELAVVRGAHETLRRARRFVVAFEAHPRQVARTGIEPLVIVRELRAIRPCTVTVAETGITITDDRTPLFEQLVTQRVLNLVCESDAEA